MKYSFIKTTMLSLALIGSLNVASHAALVEHDVLSTHNLYHTDWGHWFTAPSDGALGQYLPAPSVDYNFGGLSQVLVSATGSVVDAGIHATGPDGCPSASDPCWFKDGYYFNQPVYSLIGLWSTTSDEISPVYVGDDYTGNDSPWDDFFDAVFFIGSGGILDVPQLPDVYLFLAENDGYMADNSGSYHVVFTEVPLPGAALLMLSSLFGLAVSKRRFGK